MRKKDNISDAQIIESYQNGDKRIIALLVKRWHQTFCRVAYRYTKDVDSAKDIAQESWTIILGKLGSIEDPDKFKSWAVTIVVRRSIDWLRSKNHERAKLLTYYREKPTDLSKNIDHQHQKLKKELLLGLSELSANQEHVIRLFYIESYSLKEIAEIIGISVGTAKSRLFHAREKLKSIVKRQDHEK